MKTADKIKSRIQVGLRISESDYYIGLVYLIRCIYGDYFKLASEEDRMKGIMLRYQSEINDSFDEFFDTNLTPERTEYCGRVVFLYRNAVYSEFKFLHKRLSPADRVIVIIKRLLEFIYRKECLSDYTESLDLVNEVTTKLYDNVCWRQKTVSLRRFINAIDECFEEGYVGKQSLLNYSIVDEQEKLTKRYQDLSDTEILMEDGCNEQISIGL